MTEEEPMHEWKTLTHVKWDCKYHVIWIPKYRKKVLYGKLRAHAGRIIRELCVQYGVELVEGHMIADHVHAILSIPPKLSVARVMGFLKGKSAVRIHREVLRNRRMTGLHFWAKGYCVSTIGLDEHTIREYVQKQEEQDQRLDQLDLGLED